jgi:hypothetical protein
MVFKVWGKKRGLHARMHLRQFFDGFTGGVGMKAGMA